MHFRLVDFIRCGSRQDEHGGGPGNSNAISGLPGRGSGDENPRGAQARGKRTKLLIHEIAAAFLPPAVASDGRCPFRHPFHYWLRTLVEAVLCGGSELMRDGVAIARRDREMEQVSRWAVRASV